MRVCQLRPGRISSVEGFLYEQTGSPLTWPSLHEPGVSLALLPPQQPPLPDRGHVLSGVKPKQRKKLNHVSTPTKKEQPGWVGIILEESYKQFAETLPVVGSVGGVG